MSELWFRKPIARWERMLVDLQAAAERGVEFSRDSAIEDLNYWTIRSVAAGKYLLPSRTKLAERWPGWTDKRIRLLLASEDEWVEPMLAERWAALRPKGPAEGQPRASEGPAEGQKPNGKTPKTEQKGPAEGQPRASEGPAEGHTRGVVQEQEQEQQHPAEREKGPDLQPAVAVEPSPHVGVPNGEAEQAIAEAVAIDLLRDPALGINHRLSSGDQRAIREVIRSGSTAADVKLVCEWAHNAGHTEAIFLRERRMGWRSVLNDRFRARLELAKAWDIAGRPANEPVQTPPARAAPQARASPEAAMRERIEAFARKHAVSDGYVIEQEPEYDLGA